MIYGTEDEVAVPNLDLLTLLFGERRLPCVRGGPASR